MISFPKKTPLFAVGFVFLDFAVIAAAVAIGISDPSVPLKLIVFRFIVNH
jgi:hypothetical protein